MKNEYSLRSEKTIKFAVTILLVIGIFAIPLIIGVVQAREEYRFENVNVLIIGRCRTIISDGTWIGGFYQGSLPYTEVQLCNTTFERLSVIVYNKTIFRPWRIFVTCAGLGMREVDGTFYWGARGNGFSLIPPRIFIRCHAELLVVGKYNETIFITK